MIVSWKGVGLAQADRKRHLENVQIIVRTHDSLLFANHNLLKQVAYKMFRHILRPTDYESEILIRQDGTNCFLFTAVTAMFMSP